MPGRGVPLTDRGVERGDVGIVQFACQRAHRIAIHQALQRQSAAANLLDDGVLTGFQGLLAAFLGEPLPDLGLGARGHHEGLPVPRRARIGGLGGENLDLVPVFELALQRHQPVVHPGTDTAVSDLGVHGVGEVHRGGPGGQCDDIALGGEDEDLLHGEVVAQ